MSLTPADFAVSNISFRIRNDAAIDANGVTRSVVSKAAQEIALHPSQVFMRRDEVEAAWSWIDPILNAWATDPEPPRPYTAGTWGPSAAIALVERDGRTWHEDLEAHA